MKNAIYQKYKTWMSNINKLDHYHEITAIKIGKDNPSLHTLWQKIMKQGRGYTLNGMCSKTYIESR